MSQSDRVVVKGTSTLQAVTESACRRGLLVQKAALCQFREQPVWGTHGTTVPTRILPYLSREAGLEKQEKKDGDMMGRKWLGKTLRWEHSRVQSIHVVEDTEFTANEMKMQLGCISYL